MRDPLRVVLALALIGCAKGEGPVGCRFRAAHLHAHAEGAFFDDVAIAESADGAQLAWSDRSGLRVATIGPLGQGRGAPRVLGGRCQGGIALDGAWLACAQRPDRDRAREGGIVLFTLPSGGAVARFGPVGDESVGVDLAVDGPRVVVGWRDADAFGSRAWIAERIDDRSGEPRPLSSFGTFASAPALRFVDRALVSAWTEAWIEADGTPSGHLLAQREGEPPRPSLDVSDFDVRVDLVRDAEGPLVALRDRRPRAARPRLFVGRLDERLRLVLDRVHSPLRLDEPLARPVLVPCGPHVFAVGTRRSSRDVTMVVVRRLDRALREAEPEHQIYEYHARFPQAAAACLDGGLIVAVAERQSEVQARPRLRTFALECGPSIPHERTPAIEGQVLRKRGAGPAS